MTPVHQIFFLDIETVPQVYDYKNLLGETQALWDEKIRFKTNEETSAEDLYNAQGGILAEFAQIVCISVGIIYMHEGQPLFKCKSFAGEDEKTILREFADMLEKDTSRPYLCAHNGKEFDFPVLCRRMLIHGIPLPSILKIQGKKPWEIPHIDTLELWKFGDYKHYTSLKLLAHVFGIPSPKNDISGSDVARVYFEENDIERIVKYCEKDTLTVAQVYLALQGKPMLDTVEL